jgi:hypothetical protein
MTTLNVTHSHGFFSCCSVRLHEIIKYFNSYKGLPDVVNSSKQFKWYKVNINPRLDVTFFFFDNYNNYNKIDYVKNIDYDESYQYSNYSDLKYEDIMPFIKKYFSPSVQVNETISYLEKKYIIDYENICVLFYRGNDKITETSLSSYNDYIMYSREVLSKNPNTIFFIQSDETEFIEAMTLAYPNNSFYMKDEIRHMRKCNNTVDKVIKKGILIFSKGYLAITIMMSRCKFIICGSGNCSIWIMLYRGNNKNVYQFKEGKWFVPS